MPYIKTRDGTDIYFARQQVAERLTQVRQSLPAGAEPAMGPISSGLGEVLMWTVAFEHPGGKGAKAMSNRIFPCWHWSRSRRTRTREFLLMTPSMTIEPATIPAFDSLKT